MGKTEEELVINARKVLDKFKNKGIRVKPSKCQWGLEEVTYLGHVASGEGVRMSDERKEVLQQMNRPETLTQLRSFIGLANYFSRFVKIWRRKNHLDQFDGGSKIEESEAKMVPRG